MFGNKFFFFFYFQKLVFGNIKKKKKKQFSCLFETKNMFGQLKFKHLIDVIAIDL